MEISFKTKGLRELSEKKSLAIAKFGDDDANRLHNRIADLSAAKNISDIFVGSPTKIKIGESIGYQLNFGLDKKIVISANHVRDPLPLTQEELIDWAKVSRIKIISIGGSDYDDN